MFEIEESYSPPVTFRKSTKVDISNFRIDKIDEYLAYCQEIVLYYYTLQNVVLDYDEFIEIVKKNLIKYGTLIEKDKLNNNEEKIKKEIEERLSLLIFIEYSEAKKLVDDLIERILKIPVNI